MKKLIVKILRYYRTPSTARINAEIKRDARRAILRTMFEQANQRIQL